MPLAYSKRLSRDRNDSPSRFSDSASSGSTMADPKRFRFSGDSYYVKSPSEIRELWAVRNGMPEACDNSLWNAERCTLEFND